MARYPTSGQPIGGSLSVNIEFFEHVALHNTGHAACRPEKRARETDGRHGKIEIEVDIAVISSR